MEQKTIQSTFLVCQKEELSQEEQQLIDAAIEATSRSYAPYSHFHVGAAIQMKNGVVIMGCNQENAAFPAAHYDAGHHSTQQQG